MRRKGRRRARNERADDLPDHFGCSIPSLHMNFIQMEDSGPCEADEMKHTSLRDRGA